MTNVTFPMLAAPGRERPDYTIFEAPAANLTDTSAEEIEIDQALSLQGRQGRDLLGVFEFGALNAMAAEHLTIAGADHSMRLQTKLQTRTGDRTPVDPELLWIAEYLQAYQAGATDTAGSVWNPTFQVMPLGEPELYVAPRLFYRMVNDIDATITAGAVDVRIASVSRQLTFELFIELLERFADVTLL